MSPSNTWPDTGKPRSTGGPFDVLYEKSDKVVTVQPPRREQIRKARKKATRVNLYLDNHTDTGKLGLRKATI